jgi:hypothetical protein
MNALDPIISGSATSYPIQCRARGDISNSAFLVGDTLTAYVCQGWQPQFPPASYVFQPSIGWYTADGTQTGYDEGQVLAVISNALSTMLVPTANYTLIVGRSPSGAPGTVEEIVRIKLPVQSATVCY